ncbi:hypothetical protein COU15_01880 [Candidatus Kaiserbacteria bacterium CG10_big_fil_rev_8_21_14_0_10_45_20]|uniref:Type 4 fimbrial biogenesis protein PilX N-terminal domain-containing protein n=1 Tax=Candidatus Kaiserbacteria bacterium CG10_big_fil_rev_8_21_14_0_10_45_20 TaxID=1974607 RepID=A0A2H0UFG1_9BACT|nr:MAG: hypothetical protein COU15_01880 [Candidatus Kaiserbacteria bacterium CG10_big_fil_rev_8_21_14_0_10_45_20]
MVLKKMNSTARGSFVLLTLVFSAVFLTLITSLSGYIFIEKRAQLAKENLEKSLHIAEAGLNYYRWRLAHFPGDITDGTGNPGPYVHTFSDPEEGTIGSFSLEISGQTFCGVTSGISITSTGWTNADPSLKRSVRAVYTRPSVAEYSHIVDANVWAGSDRIISGPYHSNGGVRMDGTHNSTVSSGVSSWYCSSSFGCSPQQNQPGVFGSGSNPELWSYPTTPVDFGGITVDLAELRQYAIDDGVFIENSNRFGWRVVFNGDGTFDVRKVQSATKVWEYSTEDGWQQERRIVGNQQSATTYSIPADCPVVFIEDDIWVEGVVSGKVILASADVTNPGVDHSVVLSGNITYANESGDGITIIGEENVLIGIDVPNEMTIQGVFIAQKGRFGRNHYCDYDCSSTKGNQSVPGSLDEYVTRSTLNTIGTVVSKERVGTKWTSGGAFLSGFNQRNDSFDKALADSPPPFTPYVSEDYLFRSWREVN